MVTDRSQYRAAHDRRVGEKRPPEGGGRALRGIAALPITALSACFLSSEGTSPNFPESLVENIVSHRETHILEFAEDTANVCLIGEYTYVDHFLESKGITSAIDVYVSENDFVVVLEKADGSIAYAYFGAHDSATRLERAGCFPGGQITIRFKERHLNDGSAYFKLVTENHEGN
jgi:hypothetical protein